MLILKTVQGERVCLPDNGDDFELERAQVWAKAIAAGLSTPRKLAVITGKSPATIRRWIRKAEGMEPLLDFTLRPAFPADVTIPLAVATCGDVHPNLDCPHDDRCACVVCHRSRSDHCLVGLDMSARTTEGGPTSYAPGSLKGGR